MAKTRTELFEEIMEKLAKSDLPINWWFCMYALYEIGKTNWKA